MSKKQKDERERENFPPAAIIGHLPEWHFSFEFVVQLKWCSKMVDIIFGV